MVGRACVRIPKPHFGSGVLLVRARSRVVKCHFKVPFYLAVFWIGVLLLVELVMPSEARDYPI